jgi:hypothetical protein
MTCQSPKRSVDPPTVRIARGKQLASVLDVIRIVLGDHDLASRAWDIISSAGEVTGTPLETAAKNIKQSTVLCRFRGTPGWCVGAPVNILLDLIYLLPGARADCVRLETAQSIVRYLRGDIAAIDAMEVQYAESYSNLRAEFRNILLLSPDPEIERRLRRIRHEEAVVALVEARVSKKTIKNRNLTMDGIFSYQRLLASVGLERHPRLCGIVKECISNLYTPLQNTVTGEILDPRIWCTISAYITENSVYIDNIQAYGKLVANVYRSQFGEDPASSIVYLNDVPRPVKVYQRKWLRQYFDNISRFK